MSRESNIPVGRLIDCTLEENGATNFSVQDGTHASLLANSIYDADWRKEYGGASGSVAYFARCTKCIDVFLGSKFDGIWKMYFI